MNDMILERYYKLLDERESPKGPSKEEIERQDKLMAIRLLKSDTVGPITRRGGPTKVVKKKTTRKATPNTAFNAEHILSLQLQAVVGGARMSRPQVVKQIWVYIKEHGLQDPKDKRKVKCDEKLQAVFKKLVVGMFEMNKLLGNHLYKDEDLVDGEIKTKKVEVSLSLPDIVKRNGTKVKTEDIVKPEDDELSEMSDVDED
ncbi:CIC11C00000002788 [Sungouiella intermedia]|uniref:CIC11C00000000240 n=1 Tax=Sungouiella intermedia TaxID=45354 RepID=A0A1L0BPF9_9ASCO|nr:CIC11C00000002788 [[Candida] intermedia]SGZ53249.1 CIC11C00000000240 [[Candida] intermedia]